MSRRKTRGLARPELRLLVRPGDALGITSTGGGEVTGKLLDLSSGVLVMRVGDRRQEWREGEVATVTALYGGIGAGIGAGVDALISKRVVIFERRSAGASLGFAPILNPGRKGAFLTIGF